MFHEIKKRDGRIVAFDKAKITDAIFKAAQSVGGSDKQKADELSDAVVKYLEKTISPGQIPNVENVQDIVEKILIEYGHAKTAKSYILYRKQHSDIREINKLFKDFNVIDDYLEEKDWRVKENSNMSYSLQGLNSHITSTICSLYWLQKIYPHEISRSHKDGDFHIHDLGVFGAYCVGWDMRDLLFSGFRGVRGKVESAPAKHFRVALGQIINFFYTLQGESAGAQAFSNFDTYLAPFIHYDNLNYKDVYQAMQEFMFNINVPTRVGFQCLSEDTEILTIEGWKRYDEIEEGMEIKTFNTEKGIIEDKKVKSIFKRKYRGIMYNLKNRIQDQLISPGHMVVRKKFQTNKYVPEPIEEVMKLKSPVFIPTISKKHETLKNEKIKIRNTRIITIEKVNYSGIIWCPNTENETVVARRNGKVFITGNTPFTNITMDLKVPDFMKNEPVVIGGKLMDRTYGTFQKEMDMINKVFAEIMLHGDAKGRVFTFPIPTYNITNDFDWDNDDHRKIWEMTAKYGIPYFSNFINSDMQPEDVRSMCCRLRISNKELRKRGGGLFGANPLTGSCGVVTINLPRIGYISKNENEFFGKLEYLMNIAKQSLEIKREVIEKFTDRGLYPYSKFYLRNIKKSEGKYWKNHFSTIGLVGMNEALLNFIGKNITTKEGINFSVKILDFMRNKLSEYQEETGNIYNLEATPAESTSHRLARIDRKKYPKIIIANMHDHSWPYYTNSTQLPVGFTNDIFEALELQDSLQTRYTGGTVLHCFLGERMPSGEATKNLVKKVFHKYRLPYFTLTPTFSICPIHGYLAGEHFYCPVCDKISETKDDTGKIIKDKDM